MSPCCPPIPGTYLNVPPCLKCLLIPGLFKLDFKHNLLTAHGHDCSSHLILLRRPPLHASDLWEKPGLWPWLMSLPLPPPVCPASVSLEVGPRAVLTRDYTPTPTPIITPQPLRGWGLNTGQLTGAQHPRHSVGTTRTSARFTFIRRHLYKLFFSIVFLVCLSSQVSLSQEAETRRGSLGRRLRSSPPSP